MDRSKVPAVLSIAGSDSSGGAGIQADIKTITAHRLYAETAITAITAQNTLGVTAVQNISPDIVAAQIDAVFDDIRPSAVKIGMVSSAEIIEVIADRLGAWDAQNIVVDPVMVATSGARLIAEDAAEALTRRLFPLATVITPNIPEAMALLDYEVDSERTQQNAAMLLTRRFGCASLVKGGHFVNEANDVLAEPAPLDDEGNHTWAIRSPRGSATSASRPATRMVPAARFRPPSPVRWPRVWILPMPSTRARHT